MNLHIDLGQVTQVAEIIGSIIAIDGIIKQVALKQGNTKLVSLCDLVANDLTELLVLVKALLSAFKPTTGNVAQTNTTTTEVKP